MDVENQDPSLSIRYRVVSTPGTPADVPTREQASRIENTINELLNTNVQCPTEEAVNQTQASQSTSPTPGPSDTNKRPKKGHYTEQEFINMVFGPQEDENLHASLGSPTTGIGSSVSSRYTPMNETDSGQAHHNFNASDWGHLLDSSPSITPPKSPVSSRAKTPHNRVPIPRSAGVRTSFQMPNLTFRLMCVMFMLKTPEAILESPRGPDCLANNWHIILEEVRKSINRRAKIPLLERRLYHEHIGFLYVHRMAQLEEYLQSMRTRTHYRYQETVGYFGNMTLSTNFCPECNVIHSYAPAICTTHFNHGPRIMEFLEKWNTWRSGIHAAVIGCDTFYYLPREQKFSILNLGGSGNSNYYIPQQVRDYELNINIGSEASAYYSILIKLQALGPTSRIPVFIEYFRSTSADTEPRHLQIIGFLNLIRLLQRKYLGPLVAIMGPCKYLAGEMEETYIERKQRNRSTQNLLKLVGNCLGVPVGILSMQHHETDSEIILEGWWRDEPIYGATGRPTREYFSRMRFWFENAIYFLSQDPVLRHP
jgi:hypothetical protein